MSSISGILCQIITGNVDGAGTDGRVYLGLGGREFRLDPTADDYEKHSWREYILGAAPNEPQLASPQIRVKYPDRNDPRQGLPLDTDNLNRTPAYLRFEPQGASDDWDLAFAAALVYGERFITAYTLPADFHNLWLGQATGKVVYLTTEWQLSDQALLDVGRQVARKVGERAPRS
jgi:hypothetical protein